MGWSKWELRPTRPQPFAMTLLVSVPVVPTALTGSTPLQRAPTTTRNEGPTSQPVGRVNP